MADSFPYDFTLSSFEYRNVQYRLALTPELYGAEDGLEFTGNYCCLLISETKGTQMFELQADTHSNWNPSIKGLDPGLIDEIDKIITSLRNKG